MDTPALHLLVPFALPPAAEAAALVAGLELPALEKLLARASLTDHHAPADPFQRTLPHERWLARSFGLPGSDDQTPLAPYMLLADGGIPGERTWLCAQPVHIHIARDHLVLTDPSDLELAAQDAADLHAAALPLMAGEAALIAPPDARPARWYLADDALGALHTTSLMRACGHNIDIWMPTGDGARAWLKLQNEIQMTWFDHPVNARREALGLPPVNSLWLYGGGALASAEEPARHLAAVRSDNPATRGLAMHHGIPVGPPADDCLAPAAWPKGATLVELGELAGHFIRQDWARWRDALVRLENAWFAPALAQLEQGDLTRLSLTLCGDTQEVTLLARRGDLRKFWRRGPLASRLAGLSAI